MTDTVIRSRIDPRIKTQAVKIFHGMGLTISEAIRLFLYQSVSEKRIPFSIGAPNKLTRKTLDNINNGKNLEKTSILQLKEEWGK